jgi:Domain of unknown function DUF11
VSSFHLRRLTSIVTAAFLAVMLFGSGIAQATPPRWAISAITSLPPTVGVGANAGYSFSVTNNGPSNISALYLLATDVTAPATYAVWQKTTGTTVDGQGSCPTTGQLNCALGALNAGQTVSFVVAYAVGTSNFSVNFQLNTTGSIITPNGHNHGDVLQGTGNTSVSNSQNFGGGFIVGDTSVQDFQTIGKKNPQATSLVSPATIIPATVEDGITTGIACNNAHCANAFGEWSRINVNNGQVFGAPFKVTLLLYGGAVPGGANASNIVVLHTLDDGVTTETISADCTYSGGVPTNAECRTVTKVGNNYQIDVWLFKNGSLKGAI